MNFQEQGEDRARDVTISPSLAPAMEAEFRAAVSYMQSQSLAGREPGEASPGTSVASPLSYQDTIFNKPTKLWQLQAFTSQKFNNCERKFLTVFSIRMPHLA